MRKTVFSIVLAFLSAVSFAQNYTYSAYHDFKHDKDASGINLKALAVRTSAVGALNLKPSCFLKNAALLYTIYDGDREIWRYDAAHIERSVSVYVEGVEPWTSETPKVYTLRISRGFNMHVDVPLIFKDVEYAGGVLRVCGYESKIKAVQARNIQVDDIRTIRDMNFNTLVVDEITEALDSAAMYEGLYLLKKADFPTWKALPSSEELVGMETADRKEIAYQNRPVHSYFNLKNNSLGIFNDSFYRDLQLHMTCLQDGRPYKSRDYNLSDLACMSYKNIVPDISGIPETGEIFMDLIYTSGDRVVSSEQFVIRSQTRLFREKAGICCVNERPGAYVFEGEFPDSHIPWVVSISRKTGALCSYLVGGKELISTPLMAESWIPENLSGVQLRRSGEVIVASNMGILKYNVCGDGSVELTLTCMGATRFNMAVPASWNMMKYYGRGTEDVPAAGYHYGRIGLYTQPVGTAHSDLRWMEVIGQEGKGMRFLSDNSFVLGTSGMETGTSIFVCGPDKEFRWVIQPVM